MPLTSSLYVPGFLASTSTVLVDVGTGFYVEKSVADAKAFYDGKVQDIGSNLKDLEKVIQNKSGNLRVVEDGTLLSLTLSTSPCLSSYLNSDGTFLPVLRQKVLSGGATSSPSTASAAS